MKGLIVIALLPLLVPARSAAQGAATPDIFPGARNLANFSLPATMPTNVMAPSFTGFGSTFGLSSRFDAAGAIGVYRWVPSPYYDENGYLGNYSEAGFHFPTKVSVGIGVFWPEVPAVPPSPPQPMRSELREYHWPGSTGNRTVAFSIVGNDATVHPAIAVWVQDSMVCFTTTGGAGGQLPLAAVDRERTRRANAEQHLTLPLPAETRKSAIDSTLSPTSLPGIS